MEFLFQELKYQDCQKKKQKEKLRQCIKKKKEEEIDIKYEDFETTLNPTLLEVNYNIDKAIEDAYLVGRKR